MGHIRLGVLPKSKKWEHVIALLDGGAAVQTIAASAAEAAEGALKRAAGDPGFSHAFWLLTQLPLAAGQADFAGELHRLGLRVRDSPGLLEIVGALSDAIEAHARRHGKRTDFGEMAQLSAAESVTAIVGRSLPGLFGPTANDVKLGIARLATDKNFAEFTREFFARLTRRYLEYYLSRELPNHVGPNARFSSSSELAEFNRDLDLHCREASRILKEFAPGWYGKTRHEEGEITPEAATRFAHVAFKKIRNELRQRREADA